MTDKKDDLPAIASFRPSDESASSVNSALARLTAARRENTAEIARLTDMRPQLLLSGTAAEIDKNDTTIRKRRILIEQFDLLEPELRKMAGEAQISEENREYIEQLAEVRARADAWNAKLRAEYPALCQAFTPLFTEEKKIRRAIESLTQMPGARRVGGENATNTFFAFQMMCAAYRDHALARGQTFESAIRFPPIPEDGP